MAFAQSEVRCVEGTEHSGTICCPRCPGGPLGRRARWERAARCDASRRTRARGVGTLNTGLAEYGEQQLGEKGVLDCRAQGRGRCVYGDGEHALEAPVSPLDTGETAGALWRRSCRDACFDQGPVGRTATYPLEARPEASGAPSAFGGLPPLAPRRSV